MNAKRNINIGLVWVDPYTGNLGVTALLYSALFILEKVAKDNNLIFKYYVLSSRKNVREDAFQLGNKIIRVNILPWRYNGSLRGTLKLFMINFRHIFNLMKIDMVFDVGAGDSFSDIYGIGRFRQINAIKRIFRVIDKKVILLPQTYGPFKTLEAREKALKSIQNAYSVIARDIESFNYIKNLLPDLKIIQSIDLAFFMPYSKIKIDRDDEIKVGINLSGLLWNGGYTNDNQFGLKTDYQGLMKCIIRNFLKTNNIKIFLIAHVIPEDRDNIENDYKVCELLNSVFVETVLAPRFNSPVEAKSFISGLDFFVGGRMHSCIAAFSAGVPVFPLAYSRKFNGLFKDTLSYPFLGDLLTSNCDQIIKDLNFTFDNKGFIRNRIYDTIPFIKQKELELINILSDGIQGE